MVIAAPGPNRAVTAQSHGVILAGHQHGPDLGMVICLYTVNIRAICPGQYRHLDQGGDLLSGITGQQIGHTRLHTNKIIIGGSAGQDLFIEGVEVQLSSITNSGGDAVGMQVKARIDQQLRLIPIQ